MIFIVVEDEPIILEGEINILRECEPDAAVFGFSDAETALDYMKNHPADVVFIDIMLPGRNGIDLARDIKSLQPRTNIVFVTAYDDHYREAMELRASGYILKPMTKEDVTAELEELRYPARRKDEGLFIRTFGDFEVFFNGVPIHFKYSKTKELFAYLIDRKGAAVANGELIAILWEGDPSKKEYLKQLKKDLGMALKIIGCEDILNKRRGEIGIIPERVPCDLYYWRYGLPEGLNAYQGEYMNQYSWAETTRAALELRGDAWL